MPNGLVVIQPAKPPLGAPCNGCGSCCQQQACDLSVQFLDSTVTPCIALEWDGERYRCGLITRPGQYLGVPRTEHDIADAFFSQGFALLLGTGRGCDAFPDGASAAFYSESLGIGVRP